MWAGLFMVVLAVAVYLGWLIPCAMGVARLWTARRRGDRKAPGLRLLAIGVVWLTGSVCHASTWILGRYDWARMGSCANGLHRTHVALAAYAQDHQGSFPAHLSDLEMTYLRPRETAALQCPVSEQVHRYRKPSSQPEASDIVCWDAVPHRVRRGFLDRSPGRFRRVLYGDGTVRLLQEREFAAVHRPEGLLGVEAAPPEEGGIEGVPRRY